MTLRLGVYHGPVNDAWVTWEGTFSCGHNFWASMHLREFLVNSLRSFVGLLYKPLSFYQPLHCDQIEYRVKRKIIALENSQHGLVTEMQKADSKKAKINFSRIAKRLFLRQEDTCSRCHVLRVDRSCLGEVAEGLNSGQDLIWKELKKIRRFWKKSWELEV